MKKLKRCGAWLLALVLLVGSMSGLEAVAADGFTLESLYFTDASGAVLLAPQGKTAYPNVCVTYAEGTALGGTVTVTMLAADGTALGTADLSADTATVVHAETYRGEVRAVLQGAAIAVPSNATDIRATLQNTVEWAPASDEDAYIGEMLFPEPFYSMMKDKFTITREDGVREYSTTMNADSFHDWSKATEIFLSTKVNYANAEVKTRLGTEKDKPITSRNFVTQYKAGAYKTADGAVQNSFIFTLVDDFYSGANDMFATNVFGIPLNNSQYNANLKLGADVYLDALIRSGSPSGFTWMGSIKTQSDPDIVQKWAPLDGYDNVYTTKQSSWAHTPKVITLFNFAAADENGIPRPYVFVDTVAEVEATPGTFTQLSDDLATVYCHPRGGEQVADIALQWEDNFLAGIRHESACSKQTIVFENIGFMPRVSDHINNQFGGGDFDKAVFAYLGCKFTGGVNNTLSLIGKYTAYLNNCVAAYGFRDNFNYHSAAPNGEGSRVIEVNCRAYGNGDFNRINGCPALSADTANANNCSTAHDNMYILRVGGRYTDSQGHHVGDTATNMSLNVGCEAYNIVTSPSHATTFSFKTQPQAWVVDSYATGTRVRYGIQSGETNTTVLGNRGRTLAGLVDDNTVYELPTITWEQVARGVWETDAPLKEVSSIALSGMKTAYAAGEALDRTVGTVQVTFADGTAAAMKYAYSGITVTGYDANKGGNQTVTVSYGGKSATYTVSVEGAAALLGDVDGNGRIDSTDARLVLQYAVKKITAADLNLETADVDGSGTVDSTDARLILQFSVQKITEFPAPPKNGGALPTDFFTVTTESNHDSVTIHIGYNAKAPLLDGQFSIAYPTGEVLSLTAVNSSALPNMELTREEKDNSYYEKNNRLYFGFMAEDAIAKTGDIISLTFESSEMDTAEIMLQAEHVVMLKDGEEVRYEGEAFSIPFSFERPPYIYTVSAGNATITGVKENLSGAVIIPAELDGYPVVGIARFALAEQMDVTAVILPEGLTSIGHSAFAACVNLAEIHLPSTLTYIGISAFEECGALAEITIPDGVTNISNRAFSGCYSLEAVTLPAGVTRIGVGAFAGCASLRNVYYGDYTVSETMLISELNTALTDATWHCVPCTHAWDDVCDTVCDVCGLVREAPHSRVNTEAVAPDCDTEGKTAGSHCDLCGEVFAVQETLPASGHAWDEGTVTLAPTHEAAGKKTFVCGNCGETREQKLEALPQAEIVNGIYYLKGERVPYAGLVLLDGAYYYVNDNSRVVTGRHTVSNVNETGVERGVYYFFEDGRMNTQVGVYDGYYYNAVGQTEAYVGMIEWNGAKYYVNGGGKVQVGNYYVSNLNGLLPKKRICTFMDDGRLIEDTRVHSDGYYYVDGVCTPYAGMVEYEGAYYYVNDGGKYVTDCVQVATNVNETGKIKGARYRFDQNGKMLFDVIVDGFYYGADGAAPSYAGVVKVDGHCYYVSGAHGTLTRDKTVAITYAKANGLLPAGTYTADTNGVLTMVG